MRVVCLLCYVFCCKQKTEDEMRISDWISDVCSSYLPNERLSRGVGGCRAIGEDGGVFDRPRLSSFGHPEFLPPARPGRTDRRSAHRRHRRASPGLSPMKLLDQPIDRKSVV